MISNRHIHINTKEDFEENKDNIQDSSIVFCKESGEIVTHGEEYGKPTWEDFKEPKTIEFIFNQTGEGEVITPITDTGLLDYLVNNIKCYQGKYQKDESMLVTKLITNIGSEISKYEINIISYLNGEDAASLLLEEKNTRDFFTKIPAIYYKSTEIEPDKFKIRFSTSPFNGCHKVFGDNVLIGFGSGYMYNNRWYSNHGYQSGGVAFSQAKAGINLRGEGYYGMTSDEMGVLMFLNIYDSGVNGNVLSYKPFLGVSGIFVNGSEGRLYLPNIEINNLIAKIVHLDGNIEYLELPYIWAQNFSKLYIGEYLTVLPKEVGNGIYRISNNCWGSTNGIGIYTSGNNNWAICYDRGDEEAKGVRIKVRPCFKGKIIETQDVDYFKSLPIIN